MSAPGYIIGDRRLPCGHHRVRAPELGDARTVQCATCKPTRKFTVSLVRAEAASTALRDEVYRVDISENVPAPLEESE